MKAHVLRSIWRKAFFTSYPILLPIVNVAILVIIIVGEGAFHSIIPEPSIMALNNSIEDCR